MPKRKRDGQAGWSARRHYAYAACTAAEHAVIRRFAEREKLSISDFVRRCVNGFLIEEGDDVPLLSEYTKDPVN